MSEKKCRVVFNAKKLGDKPKTRILTDERSTTFIPSSINIMIMQTESNPNPGATPSQRNPNDDTKVAEDGQGSGDETQKEQSEKERTGRTGDKRTRR